jgi:Flp pilus assembly protein TadD
MFKRRKRKKDRAAAISQGRRLFATSQYQETREFLEQAGREFPEDPEIQLLYASILLEFQPDDVASEAAKAIKLAPSDPVILVRAASLLLNRGEVEAARSATTHARELIGSDFVLMSGLVNLEGLLASLDGEDELAEERLREAIEIDPDFSSFAVHLARFLSRRGRQAEAVEIIDDALDQAKDKDELQRLRDELIST